MKTQFKLSDLLGWVVVMFIIFLIGLLSGLLFHALTNPEQKQGRLIKPFPKDTIEYCGWCRAVKAYSLNINCVHYGDSLR